jgi:hypothetical protein
MNVKTLLAVVALAGAPILASAATYTYNVNYNFGPSLVVTGSVTTDSNSGVLATADFVDWNLLLNDGTQTLSLLGPLSGNNSQEVLVPFGDVVASPTVITYNFDDTNFNALDFQSPSIGSGANYLCYQGVGGGCNDFNGAHIAIQIGTDAVQEQAMSGVQVIATASATPEPSSFALLGVGILAVIGAARRKLHR